MRRFLLLTVIKILATNIVTAEEKDGDVVELTTEHTIGRDFVHCMEQGNCGLSSVCAYDLVEAGGQCNKPECDRREGYVMRVTNDMDYSVKLAWGLMGDSTQSPATDRHAIAIPAHDSRYFDTHLGGTQSVWLYDASGESLDKIVAFEKKRCTAAEACDFLLHACHGASEDPDHIDCQTYSTYCHGLAELSAREECFQSCATTYLGHLLPAAGSQRLTSSSMVSCIEDASKYAAMLADQSATASGHATTIMVLAGFLGLAVLAIAWLVKNRVTANATHLRTTVGSAIAGVPLNATPVPSTPGANMHTI